MAITGSGLVSGGITVQVSIENNASDTVEIIDVDEISYNLDIVNDSETAITEVNSILGESSITLYDYMESGDRLSENLDALKLKTLREFDVDITFTVNGTDYLFPLFSKEKQYTVDPVKDTVTLKLVNQKANSVGTPTTQNIFQDDDGGVTDTVAMSNPEDSIEAMLDAFGVSSYVIDSAFYTNSAGTNGFPDGSNVSPMIAFFSVSLPILRQVAKSASAIFGSAFNVGFFVDRTSVNNKVTLTGDDIIKLSETPIAPDVNTIDRIFNNSGAQANAPASLSSIEFTTTPVTLTVDTTKDQDIDITATSSEYAMVEYNATNSRTEISRSTISGTTAFNAVNTAAQDGIYYYSKGFETGSPSFSPQWISIELNSVDVIKPYEPFDIEDVYGKLGTFTSKTYRPSKYSVDFKKGTISITAYRIA